MDWETLYCPNPRCWYYEKSFKIARLVRDGSGRGEPRARCQACGSGVTLNYGTAHYGLGSDAVKFEKQLRLSLVCRHLALPHASLRTPLSVPEPTHGTGSLCRRRPGTPAMATGITDHVWTTRELLTCRVSPPG